jgi:ABC-type sugar transport system substrate-binding protein
MKKWIKNGLASALLTTSACVTPLSFADDGKLNIGITMTSFDNPFLTILLNGMKQQAEKTQGLELQVEDANLDIGRQINQVQSFIASDVDVIIVNAVDGDSTQALTQMATEAGIPLVYTNHPPADLDTLPEGTAFVGSNELDSGTMQTEEVCRQMNGQGQIVVMMGPLSNHAAITRTDDIYQVLKQDACKGISVVEKQSANWSRTEAHDLMTNWLTAGIEFDAVIANNDEMAIGAIQALQAFGREMDSIIVAGIDATPDGLQAMSANELDVTVFQNATRQGEVTIDTAVKLAKDQPTDRQIWVPFELVTPENLSQYNP